MITLTFDEDLHATDPALANFTVTIGDQSHSGATFIASTAIDATNAEQLVITLRMMVAPIAADQKVYVTYSGSDLDDVRGQPGDAVHQVGGCERLKHGECSPLYLYICC